jgi:hypothetical protein
MEEKINCRIDYEAFGNPKCRVLIDGKAVHDFVGDNMSENFDFYVGNGTFKFRILHYGKDIRRERKKFIEVKKIYFNDVDIKNMLWETIQVPVIPSWQDKNEFKWESNLYLGHNGYIEYNMRSPILDFLLEYHTYGAKVSSNMGSYNMDLLYDMKEYFSKIVKEQDEKSQ